jgi:methanogenic corrinoid protein MtbC1
MLQDLASVLGDLKKQETIEFTREWLASGEDPMALLNNARRGIEIVGQRYASGEYFLPDLVYSGEILRQVTEMVTPKLTEVAKVKKLGKVVLGTVAHDIHDIGLNMVGFMLDICGFEVYNLGVDVSAQKFVEKLKESGAPIVGLSGFLTLAFNSVKETVEAIKAAGLRDKVKIMIGGAQMNDDIRKYAGADAYGQDAVVAVSLAKQWIGGK